jgi:hypothetical protein
VQQTATTERAWSIRSGGANADVNPQSRADTFLLDTATGRVWQLVQYSDLKDTPPAWQLMKRIDNDLDLKKLQREHGVKDP